MRALRIALLALACLLATDAPALAGKRTTIAGIPLPRRSRPQDDGTYISSRSFRKSVLHFERYLKRRGHLYKRIPTYEVRGILIARFLSSSPQNPWQAIHIYKHRGRTHLFIVPAPRSDQREKPPKG